MDRNLTLESVRLTEAAALYASRHMGKADEDLAYLSAAEAMANVFEKMNIDGEIIIGSNTSEGKLKDGFNVGNHKGPQVDIAVKPLDGKMTCARGGHNAISIVAIGQKGSFVECSDGYMNKIAVGKEARGVIDINENAEKNIKRVARAKGKYIEDITVCVLDREANKPLVEEIRKTGARIKYIRDGDISGAISAAVEDNPIDILMGVGGTKEGILAAAALRCLGGDMQAKILSDLNDQKGKRVFQINDLIKHPDVMVAITGVTDGVLLPGVRYFSGGAETFSIILRQKTHTLRFVNAIHHFDFKPIFE